MTESVIPAPGVYPGIPESEYFAWRAIHSTTLRMMDQSPAHYRQAELDDTPAWTRPKVMGRAFHTAVLEPERFDECYLEGPEGAWNLKGPKLRISEIQERHPTAMPLTVGNLEKASDETVWILHPGEYRNALLAAEAIRNHGIAGKIIESAYYRELALVWDDPETELRCKAKLDAVAPWEGGRVIVDLKKTIDASMRKPRTGFAASVLNYNHDAQAAMYLDAVHFAVDVANDTNIRTRYFWIVVEEHAPHASRVLEADADVLARGRAYYRSWIDQVAESIRRGTWDAYPETVEALELPSWAWNG